jgi:hypothetical protein
MGDVDEVDGREEADRRVATKRVGLCLIRVVGGDVEGQIGDLEAAVDEAEDDRPEAAPVGHPGGQAGWR